MWISKNSKLNKRNQTQKITYCMLPYPCVRKIPWKRTWQSTPVFFAEKSHGQRSLVSYSPWVAKESDMTEHAYSSYSRSAKSNLWYMINVSGCFIGEGNGNPLQCSCLENPRDGGAWWAAICGVTQSRTQLKWLSSGCFRLERGELQRSMRELSGVMEMFYVLIGVTITWTYTFVIKPHI